MSDTKAGQKPTHEVFAAKDGAKSKALWAKIVAACPHKAGKGSSLMSAVYPAAEQAIQLRVVKVNAWQGSRSTGRSIRLFRTRESRFFLIPGPPLGTCMGDNWMTFLDTLLETSNTAN